MLPIERRVLEKIPRLRVSARLPYSISVLSWVLLGNRTSAFNFSTHTGWPYQKDPNTTISSGSKSSLSMATMWEEGRREALSKCVLPLSSDSHKGSSGRVAVLGGSARYTGAPFYAAMASLKVGADLSFVFTAEEACLPIKCYSPELMVASVYTATEFDSIVQSKQEHSEYAEKLVKKMVDEVVSSMDRIHCLVVGPGLGRCPLVFRAVAAITRAARERGLHLVFDADALYMISLPEYRGLLRGYNKAVLTPNIVEYKRLFPDTTDGDDFASVTIVRKGKDDEIDVGHDRLLKCCEEGGLKRSGGIGDILAGTIGTLAAWNGILEKRLLATSNDLPLACWTACCFVKKGTKAAFTTKKRSMTAPDILDKLGETVDSMTRP